MPAGGTTGRLNLSFDDEGAVVAVVGGVEELAGEGEALLGANLGALSALDALRDVKTHFLDGRDGLDGVSRADLDAQVAADAGFPIIGHFAAQPFRGGHGGIEFGLALVHLVQQSRNGRRQLGGGEGVGVGFAEKLSEDFVDHGEGHVGSFNGCGRRR